MGFSKAFESCHNMDPNLDPPTEPRFSNKIQNLTTLLVVRHPLESFLEHYESIVEKWIELTKLTTLPPNTSSSNALVKNAFHAIGQAMASGDIFARLANVRLFYFFKSLENLILSERKQGLLPSQSHRLRNTTIAITKLMEFEGNLTRYQIMELKRQAKRWKYLAESSAFLLLIYSKRTESIV